MSKFHLTQEGPKRCTAHLRSCPVGGEHYSSAPEAAAAFEKLYGALPSSLSKSEPVLQLQLQPLAGGRYLGAEIPKRELQHQLEHWRSLVGAERAEELSKTKAARDRGYRYHFTAVNPDEMKRLHSSATEEPLDFKLKLLGVGRVQEGENEAWFVVCSSPELSAWREKQGLPPKDLHITLGFSPKDIHSQRKDESTLVSSI